MEQTRICYTLAEECYMNATIWQDETEAIPWVVDVEGMSNSLDVRIYHEQIPGGGRLFPDLEFRTADNFARFCQKMIELERDVFRKNISFGVNDYAALKEEFRKEQNRARGYVIVSSL